MALTLSSITARTLTRIETSRPMSKDRPAAVSASKMISCTRARPRDRAPLRRSHTAASAEARLVELELEPAYAWVDLDLTGPGHLRQGAGRRARRARHQAGLSRPERKRGAPCTP